MTVKRKNVAFDLVAIGGIIGGLALLIVSIGATATEPLSFINWPSAVLVVGGTLAATFITYSPTEVFRAWLRFFGLLRTEKLVGKTEIDLFARVAALNLAGKIKELDSEITKLTSPFVRTGLQLLVDAVPVDEIGNVLEWRMKQQAVIERSEATVFRTMATYAPAFGMVGTLIGLINMLRLMGGGATPQDIGTNLAFALITTLYGLVFANALLKPIAGKIEKRSQDRMRLLGTIAEAIRAVGEHHGPSYVREVLAELASSHEDEVGVRETLGMADAGR